MSTLPCTLDDPEPRETVSARLVGPALATMVVVGFLVWLAASGAALRLEMRQETARAVRVAELRGAITTMNEWLSMSARVAALTGEPRWIARYEGGLPRLDAAIAEALTLATPTIAAQLRSTTDEANHDLVAMERAAMTRAAAGDHTGAIALLDGPEFEFLQASYQTGMDAFSQDLAWSAKTRTSRLSNRAWKESFASALTAVLLIAALFALLGHRRLRRAAARAHALSRIDALTGLANRRHLYERLASVLSDPEQCTIALLLLDLDRFKSVNDLHGHAAGDLLLRKMAALLRTRAEGGETIARLDGGKFAVIIPFDKQRAATTAAEHARRLADQIIGALSEPFALTGGSTMRIGASIGLALARPCDTAAEVLVRHAELALQRAKADRGGYSLFEPKMEDARRDRVLLETELRQAIVGDLIVPHFQPLVEMQAGRPIGFEMLARWSSPMRGSVSPGEFVPIAEELDIIGAMTANLLRRACQTAQAWPPETVIACNISPLQLRDHSLPAMIREALAGSGLAAHRLELEITESALVDDFEQARAVLLELKTLGVRLALDDFGTGYSSLRHLQMLPFDTLKIDASFVRAMAYDVESRKIVTAVIGLAKSLGLTVVAEGVEEPRTAALLRALDCDVGQGWLFGRPGSAKAAQSLLLENVGGEPNRDSGSVQQFAKTRSLLALPSP